MSFPHQKEIEKPLLAFIFLNGQDSKSIRSSEAYAPLADHFSLSEEDRLKSRDQVFKDGRTTEKAWSNLVQWARNELLKAGYLKPNSGHGIWQLSESGISEAQKIIGMYGAFDPNQLNTPRAHDIEPPDRIETTTYRILRDTTLARRLKLLHNNNCQICGDTINLSCGNNYSEAHHIKPLGVPHNGQDVEGNIIILCPNHHVQCDYGAIFLNIKEIRNLPRHRISMKYIEYHNAHIKI